MRRHVGNTIADSLYSAGLLTQGSPLRGATETEFPVPRPSARSAGWLEGARAILDERGRVLHITDAFAAWLGQTLPTLHHAAFWDCLVTQCPDWREPLASFSATKTPFAELKLSQILPDSTDAHWYLLELAAHSSGSFVRLNSVLPPLDELQEAAWDGHLRHEPAQRELFVRLLRTEAQLSSLTEHWPGVIFSQRADFTFRFASSKIEALTGVAPVDWQTKPLFWQLVHEADAEELRAQLRLAKETRTAVNVTYRIRHQRTGRITYVLEHRQPVVSRGGLLLGYEGMWLDVTRQTIAERSLSSAAWKETLSALTMGFAHDFGNVMAGIHALSESFLEPSASNSELSEGLSLIRRNAHQASQLVHRILHLHQAKLGECQYHDLNVLAKELGELIRKLLPCRLEFALETGPEALAVYVDAVELRQVVLGLVCNALDALPQAGRLVLRASGHSRLPAAARLLGTTPRLPAACLSVQDNGTGISARHLPNLFAPFFTTKSNGPGLGLYNARQFAQRQGGAVSVETQEDAGSTFHLWLPQADFQEIERAPATARAAFSQPRPEPAQGPNHA